MRQAWDESIEGYGGKVNHLSFSGNVTKGRQDGYRAKSRAGVGGTPADRCALAVCFQLSEHVVNELRNLVLRKSVAVDRLLADGTIGQLL